MSQMKPVLPKRRRKKMTIREVQLKPTNSQLLVQAQHRAASARDRERAGRPSSSPTLRDREGESQTRVLALT
jgi:hypothetical protein